MDDDLLHDFEQLKISAFSKIKKINSNLNNISTEPNLSRSQDAELNKSSVKNKTFEDRGNVTSTPCMSDCGLPIRHILKELEIRRRDNVETVVQAHIANLNEFSNKQALNKRQQWLKQQHAFIEHMQQKESLIFHKLSVYDRNNLKEHTKLVQHYQDLAERRRLQEEELKAKEKQRQILSANISNIKKHQQEFVSIYQKLVQIVQRCNNNDKLRSLLGSDFELFKSLPEALDQIIGKCKNGKLSEDDVKKASKIVIQVNALKAKVKGCVEEIDKAKEPEISIIQSVPVTSNNESVLQQKQKEVVDESVKPSDYVELNITQYVSITNLKIYTETMEFLEKHCLSFKDLESDDTHKTFKFECKKAVNTPVNSLSGISSEHILDKYNRLHQLLSGRDVLVGGRKINASSHPQGIAFCMDLLAKKCVLQGDLMVSSNPESAFCYASVIISLWNEFPTFGKLVLAYFYKFCPYLVPYYVPRQVGESDEEFYTKQGYQYVDGQIEKHDKFLKRMTGIVRLYSAILITKPKRGQTNTPHNFRHGWRLLASLVKLEPRVDITATVLHTLLETIGFEMEAKYGRVFIKLTKIIIQKLLPSCRQKCTGGAVMRLELLLGKYVKNRAFERPAGYLEYSNW